MELTLAGLTSESFVLQLKSLCRDAEEFLSSIRYVLPLLIALFSSNNKCTEISKLSDHACGGQAQSYHAAISNSEIISEDKNLIYAHEVNTVMHNLGMKYKLDEGIDGNSSFGEGVIERLFDEDEPSFEELKEAFDVFDLNKDGFIDPSELQRVITCLGFRDYDLEKCKRMIKSFDSNGDGLIDLQEFVRFMEKFF